MRLAGAVWVALSGGALIAQELSIEFESVSTSEVEVRLTGPDGESALIEVSSDMVNWEEFDRGTLQGGSLVVSDEVVTGRDWRRFYRARLLGEDEILELVEEFGIVLAGDTIALRINGGAGGDWQWSVNGVDGGNGAVGTIRVSPLDSSVAFFTSPSGAGGTQVTIRAVDGGRSVETDLEIAEIVGDLVIVPGDAVIGVGKTRLFQAGINIVDVGFLPLRSAIWKLNGLIGGGNGLGRIGLDGTYQAPGVLPATLPVTIEVGYSLSPEQAPLRTAEITLVDLKVTPGQVVRFDETVWDPDPPTQLAVERRYSDGTVETPADVDILWESDKEESVTVNSSGLLNIEVEPGQAIVTATDRTHGVRGTSTVKARDPVYFFGVQAQTLGDIPFDQVFSLLEVTEPRVTMALDPRLRITRVPFYQFNGPEPENISGRDIAAITYSATGDIVDYNQFGRIVQNTGITGRIEEKVGVVEFGDVPGQGQITISYDDGEFQNSMTVDVRYTQLDMSVTAKGSQTDGTSEVYISEWIDFDVQLTNPFEDDFANGASDFIGRMEIKVEEVGGDEFWVAYDQYVRDGELPPLGGSASQTTFIEKTDAFSGFVAPVYNPDPFGGFSSAHPSSGKARFSISPTRTGEMTFRVSVTNDPNIPPQDFTLNIIKPTLQFDGYGRPVPPENRLPAGHWLPLEETPGEPSIRSIGFVSTTWGDRFPPQWRIQRPDGEVLLTPQVNEHYDYNDFFDEPGEYRIRMELAGRPEVSTEDFVVDAPDLASFGTWPTLGDNPWRSSGSQVPASMMIGGVEVVSPRRAVWKPGVEIPIVLQLYDGEGNATRVGYSYQRRYVGGSNPRVDGPDTYLLYMDHSRASGPGFTTTRPQDTLPEGGMQDRFVDVNGKQEFSITPFDTDHSPDTNGRDLLLRFSPRSTIRSDVSPFEGEQLFEEVYTFDDNFGSYQFTSGHPIGPPVLDTANYETVEWEALHDFYLRISGHGVIFQPRRLPVPSARVRAAVAAGQLPAEAAQTRVTVMGTDGFGESLASGFGGTADLGEGVSIVSHTVDGDQLHLVLETDAAFWSTAGFNDLGIREVEFAMGDGTEWVGEFELFRTELEPTNSNEEVDLPLNSRYGLDSPIAAVGFELNRTGIAFPTLTAELTPSIHAVWDANKDGVADEDEDIDDDGQFTLADVAAGAAGFRGQFATSPLVGFSRRANRQTGIVEVRDLRVDINPGNFNELWIYGNPTDRRRVSDALQLSEVGNPDGLPDFVSGSPGAEHLALKSDGNYADFHAFTAYNFTTEYQPSGEAPEISFDELKGELHENYRRYSQFELPTNTEDVAADPKVTRQVSVWVDHEATELFTHIRPRPDPDDPNPSSLANYLYGQWPTQYYGGILDQYYQAQRIGNALFPLGQDGRVRSFTPLDPPGTPTGTTRYPFGIALDGVLYDAFAGAMPRPRLRDVFFSTVTTGSPALAYGTETVARNRFDFNPNSPGLTGIPLVSDLIAQTGALTANDLLPRLGGVSGGFVDVRSDSAPTFFVEASLPASRLPGLHAGYLISGKPSQLTDPTTEAIEDDLEEVSIVRNGEIGDAVGNPPIAEDVFLGTRQPRRVMSFGATSDKKGPVETAVRISAGFKIGTDPAAYVPANPDGWKIKAGLALTERQNFDDLGVDLIATTQSDGDEQTQKIIADAVIDIAIDLAANAILTTVTSGGYLAACSDDVVGQVVTASLGLAVGLTEQEVLDLPPGQKGPVSTYMSGTVSGFETNEAGWSPDPIRSWANGVLEPAENSTGIKRFSNPSRAISQPGIFNHCDLAKLPFNLLKERIKGSFSARTLGGLGASEAVGFKVMALCIPEDARLGDGVFSAYTNYTRRAFIQPEEQATKKLSELPWQSIWEEYPFPDEVSDEDLLIELMAKATDPVVGEDARTILRAAGAFSLQREMAVADISGFSGDTEALARESRYQSYKLRTFPMHEIALLVGPGQQVDANGENAFGDFVLTPNQTEIPVSYGAVASASRSNENANARATIRHHGIELQLVGVVIQDPANLPTPEAP